jgi:hypothetical protein
MKLIVPMAGRSSRFPGLRPKWMLTHPSGRFMGIEAIKGLNLDDFETIYFVCLQEHEDEYGFIRGFKDELDDLSLLKKTEMVVLEKYTRDQVETVASAIKIAGVSGPIVIKDSDNYFSLKCVPNDFIAYNDLNESGLIKPKNKSYVALDENDFILNIVEKEVISPYFCVGAYGFSDAKKFVEISDILKKEYEELYISNIVYQMLLDENKIVAKKVQNYIDWGTIEDWNRYKKTFATLFVDIDGTLVKNSSAHFPPYIGNTEAILENVEIIKELYSSGQFQIVLTTSRSNRYKKITEKQMDDIGLKYDHLIMGLFHSKRIIINDYSKSNPFKSCDSINLKRDQPELKEILKESLGIDYEQI